jgi:uncharacterized membrane protein
MEMPRAGRLDTSREFHRLASNWLPNTELKTLGFITREDLNDLPDGLSKNDHVVVHVQWSSQIGGYCFVVPRRAVQPVDMTVEEGMRWALTAGISAPVRLGGLAEQASESTGEIDRRR